MSSFTRPKGPRLARLEEITIPERSNASLSNRPCQVVGVLRSARTPGGQILRVMRDGNRRICAVFATLGFGLLEIGDGEVAAISGRLLAEERGRVFVVATHFERCADLDDGWRDYSTTLIAGDGGYLLEAC